MRLCVINTGGTIGCTGSPLAPLPAAKFADACRSMLDPVIAQQFPGVQITYRTDLTFPGSRSGTLDSTNLQPADWCRMAGYILKHYAECDGWIVLHGTDTMEFTGAALPFLLSSFSKDGAVTAALSKPVILTGSQLPMFREDSKTRQLSLNSNSDAVQNFYGAVAAAQTGIPEVCLYFDGRLYRGSRIRKTSTARPDAFSSPNFPPLGEYGTQFTIAPGRALPPPADRVSLDNPSVRNNAIAQLDYIAAHINNYPVMPFSAFPAWYGANSGLIAALIDACVAQGVKGLILQSYGAGNFPSGNPDDPAQGAAYQALARANVNGVVIVNCTQVLEGAVGSDYAAGAWLPAVGALGSADMTPSASLAKLMILLTAAGYSGNQWNAAEVKTLFQRNLLGEMSE
ncbi:MAG: asparaginase [Alphaproteobacteria bacterium]|nr:MAG: asparaginase [Alphaproteobacteria bacterium]